MKIIGLTGGVGSGKTQILEYLNDKKEQNVMIRLLLISEKTSWMRRKSWTVRKLRISYLQTKPN